MAAGFPTDYFDDLIGEWHLEGEILGRPLRQPVSVAWVLDGEAIQIHYRPSSVTPMGDRSYECLSLLGWDRKAERYRLSVTDTFGGRSIGFPGEGVLDDEGITFVFEYEEGRFETRFEKTATGWTIEQTSFGEDGPTPFGVKRLRR